MKPDPKMITALGHDAVVYGDKVAEAMLFDISREQPDLDEWLPNVGAPLYELMRFLVDLGWERSRFGDMTESLDSELNWEHFSGTQLLLHRLYRTVCKEFGVYWGDRGNVYLILRSIVDGPAFVQGSDLAPRNTKPYSIRD